MVKINECETMQHGGELNRSPIDANRIKIVEKGFKSQQ